MQSGSGWSRRGVLGALAALSLVPRARAAGATFSVRNATLLTHTGQRLADHGLRVEAGRIVELGPSGSFGADALDLGGAWLVPGFTDASCSVGLYEVGLEKASHDDEESSDAVTPDARARDGYNPRSEVIPVTRANGITSVLVRPAAGGLISGQAALFRTVGDTVDAALIQAPAALCINLGHNAVSTGRPGSPASRMGVMMRLRQILDDVKLPEEKSKDEEKGKKNKKKSPEKDDKVKNDEEVSPAERTLRALRRGTLPALIRADRADDLLAAVELAQAYKLKAMLLGGAEAHLVASELAGAGFPLLLGSPTAQPDGFDSLHARYDNAARLHAAGVRFAMCSEAAHHARGLPVLAGVAVAHGLPFEAAIAALTGNVWDFFGIAGMGRLEVGAEATMFQVDGDPLQPRHPVRRIWVAGQEASMESHQTRLYERYRVLR